MKKTNWMKPARDFDDYCYRYTIIGLTMLVLGFVAKCVWVSVDKEGFNNYYTKKVELIQEATESLIKVVETKL